MSKPAPAPDPASDPAAHLRDVTARHIRGERLQKLAKRDPLTRELVELVSAGEQAAADLLTAKATIASLEARVRALEAQLSGQKK